MQIVFLVCIYNKKIDCSETIKSLLYSGNDFMFSRLIIWNNGPSSISLDIDDDIKEKWHSIELIQTLDNKPLSYIYNQVIDRYPADRYVILDDDSKLTKKYIDAVICTHASVAVPAIYAQGMLRSPTVSGVFKPSPYLDTDMVIAIGSGISVRSDIAQQLKSRYGDVFDSRFALYGVDTSFFLRLHELGLSNSIELIDGFEHSLSRLENELQPISNFRQVERAYDLGLTLRHYFTWQKAMFVLFKQIIKFLLGRSSWVQLRSVLMSYMIGRHPRC